MKKFLEKLQEDLQTHTPVVMAFGRMNPPTIGHEKLVNRVKQIAQDYHAPHHIVLSHSMDTKKNPLDPETKIKHAKRLFPNTNIVSSSKDKPTFLQHAAALHAAGHDHLIMVAGSDRIPEYEKKLNQYNGEGPGKLFNFKKIEVKSAGQRDPDAEGAEGMSASKMREHAQNNHFNDYIDNNGKQQPGFRSGLPVHVPEKHAKELFRDVRRGMGLHENIYRGMFKAVFVTGGPGSGKDIILREAIPESRAVEINSVQAFDYLMDKQKLSERTTDYRREAIRNRSPLIINGPADDLSRMITIKEELEELGYDTLMVFVETTNEASKERNQKLTKMISESVRQDKWKKAQDCKESYKQNFGNFIDFDNSSSLDVIEEDITETYGKINSFIGEKDYTEIAFSWLKNNGKSLKENENAKETSKSILAKTVRKYNSSYRAEASAGHSKVSAGKPTYTKSGSKAPDFGSISADNRASDPSSGDIKWNRNAKTGSYIFRTYSEAKEGTLTKGSEPKETNFSKDKEKVKKSRWTNSPVVNQRMRNVTGVGPEFDTRQQGTVYPMSGLGDVTYREETKTFGRLMKEFKGFQNDDEGMGVGGVLGGATNKEPMQSYKDSDRNITTDTKKQEKKNVRK